MKSRRSDPAPPGERSEGRPADRRGGEAPEAEDPEIRVLGALAEVSAAEWDALVGEEGSPFLEWRWLQALEEAGCVTPERGWQPVHLTIREGGRLVAGCPAYLKGNSEGEFVFDWSWADLSERLGRPYYPKLIVAVPFTPVTGERLLVRPDLPAADRARLRRTLAGAVRGLAAQLEVSSAHVLFPGEAEAEELREAGYARRVGVQFHWRNDGYRSFDDFLGRFSSKKRHMLRRERQEVRRAGLSARTRRGPLSPAEVGLLYRLYVSTVDKFFYGRRYLNERFFELVAERMPDRLEFVQGLDGEQVVAGALNLQKAGRLYGRYWGQLEGEEHRFLHFEVCYYHSIEECIERGISVFEPGAGGEHKLARGFEPTLTWSAHDLRDGRMRELIGRFLDREEAAIQKGVAQALADSPLRRPGGTAPSTERDPP